MRRTRQQPAELVGAAARAEGDDDLHRLARPLLRLRWRKPGERGDRHHYGGKRLH
jgi:hypothetical protein